ncbi:MAG TPA: hypothetical protein VGE39_03505 [Prosthecobacter sp.]
MLLLRLLPLFCLLLVPVSVSAQGGGDPALRATLEQAYNVWRQAMNRGDARAWAGSITRYRQTMIRNAIVSERQAFPDAVFASKVPLPAIESLRLLEVQAVGDTAHLVYFGKIDLGQDKELLKDNLLKLKFGREDGQWRYDSNRITSLDTSPETRKTLQAGGAPDFLDTPEYTPPGSLPPVPALCRVPDHKGGYKIESFGYETTVSMNGFDSAPVQDGLDQQVITGGLVNGRNEITLRITPVPVPQGEKASLQVRVYTLTNESDDPVAEVLRWKAPDSGVPATVTLPFTVRP